MEQGSADFIHLRKTLFFARSLQMSSSSMHKLKQNENVSTRGKHGGKSHSDTSAPFSSEQLGKHQCARALRLWARHSKNLGGKKPMVLGGSSSFEKPREFPPLPPLNRKYRMNIN